jgi:integrase
MRRQIVVNLSSNVGYWQADWKDGSGKRRKKSMGVKSEVSRRQAKKLCQQFENELNKHPQLADNSKAPTLASFLKGYLESRTDLKPATRYLFDLTARYLKSYFGEATPIDRITRPQVREWRTAMARGDFSGGRAMAEVSVCHRCADAKTMFKRAVTDELLAFNPFDGLKVRPPKPDKDWHYVTIEQLDKLLAASPTVGWKMLIALCRLAGLRRGEALELTWPAVDWQNRRLTVFATKTERQGGNKRIIPIEPKLFGLLREAKDQAAEGERRICKVSRHCLWRNFTVIRKRAGLTAWEDAFQVMRRNAETDWAQKYPQYAVSEWIGHDITVSAVHYLNVPEELFQKAAGLIGERAPPSTSGS